MNVKALISTGQQLLKSEIKQFKIKIVKMNRQ